MKKTKKKTQKINMIKLRNTLIVVLICIFSTLIVGYSLFVFAPIPFVRNLRDLYIETAMNTRTHQWLAEAFIPHSIIDGVMAKQTYGEGGDLSGLKPVDKIQPAEDPDATDEPDPIENDILGLSRLHEGGLDYIGNTLDIVDEEQGLFVSSIRGSDTLGTYTGKIMLVDDPSRVFVAFTKYPGDRGQRLGELVETYDAIAGVNASGFYDPNENGDGGDIVGMSMSEGKIWGDYISSYPSMMITTDNKLAVGWLDNWTDYNVRDGMQFGPILIADGNIQVSGSAGWGLQPRTAVAQRGDGAMIFLVIEGRQTKSAGITVGEMAKILYRYGAKNACCCDGGASTLMNYNGQTLIQVATCLNPEGRWLPNAFLVKKKIQKPVED